MRIYAAMNDDISEGHVWIEKDGLPSRGIIKITNPENNRNAYCEALQFDRNFLNEYNKSPRISIEKPASAIVMGSWYRNRLGELETQRDYPLKIAKANSWWGKLRASMQHPQIVVRVAIYLGIVSVCLGLLGVVLAIIPTTVPKETVVTNHASGTFDVKLNPQAPEDSVGDPTVGRMSIDKQFHGDLEGTSKGQMLATTTDVKGSAGYVAMERVKGTLHGRSGTFSLQHSGTMTRGTPQLIITVVPDSGTDQLVGLAGTMTINIVDGKHFYEFDYTLAGRD